MRSLSGTAAGPVTLVDVYGYTGDPNDPVGDFISETVSDLHGPHPDLLDDSVFCDVLVPYLELLADGQEPFWRSVRSAVVEVRELAGFGRVEEREKREKRCCFLWF